MEYLKVSLSAKGCLRSQDLRRVRAKPLLVSLWMRQLTQRGLAAGAYQKGLSCNTTSEVLRQRFRFKSSELQTVFRASYFTRRY